MPNRPELLSFEPLMAYLQKIGNTEVIFYKCLVLFKYYDILREILKDGYLVI